MLVRTVEAALKYFRADYGHIYKISWLVKGNWETMGFTRSLNKTEALLDVGRDGFDTGNGKYKAERLYIPVENNGKLPKFLSSKLHV